MSTKVKARLTALELETTHEERVALDVAIEAKTGEYCDAGVAGLTDQEMRDLLAEVRRALEAKRRRQGSASDQDQDQVAYQGLYN